MTSRNPRIYDVYFRIGPLKTAVFNNQIEFTLTYKLNITEGVLKKTHTFIAVTKVTNVSVAYEKVTNG